MTTPPPGRPPGSSRPRRPAEARAGEPRSRARESQDPRESRSAQARDPRSAQRRPPAPRDGASPSGEPRPASRTGAPRAGEPRTRGSRPISPRDEQETHGSRRVDQSADGSSRSAGGTSRSGERSSGGSSRSGDDGRGRAVRPAGASDPRPASRARARSSAAPVAGRGAARSGSSPVPAAPAAARPRTRPSDSPPAPAAGRRRPRRDRPLGSQGHRLRAGLVFLLALLMVLAGRLVQLQAVSGTAYAASAEKQRRVSSVLVAPRGAITDRSGQPIAISVDGRAVSAQPRMIRAATCLPDAESPCTPAAIATALSPVIGVPVSDLTERLERDTGFVYLARDLDPDVGNRVRDLELVGISVDSEPRRLHPGNDLAANVVGFTNREGKGAGGVEMGWNSVLSGVDGSSVAEVDAGGRVIPSGEQRRVEPVPGHDVQLTLDRDLQWYAQKVLAEKVTETGAVNGSAVVMDVQTGEVLALATEPTYDADAPGESAPATWGNPAISEMYDPGSVNKIITISAAIEAGIVQPSSTLTVPYSQQVGDKLVVDSHQHSTEKLTVNGIFIQSSNVGTVQIAQQLGAERLTDAMRAYGFGAKTGIGLPGEQAGLVRDPEDWSGSSLGTIPIGQGVSVTALQVASVYQTVANDGVRVAPSIIRAIKDDEGTLVPQPAPEQRRVISAATAEAMHPMLEGVVSAEGTAPLAAIPGYRIAGKTGTADRPKAGGGYSGYTSSFVGFAPADAPRLVTAVVLQGTGSKDYFGGSTAGPVFKQVMGFGLRSTGTPPSGSAFVKPQIYADERK